MEPNNLAECCMFESPLGDLIAKFLTFYFLYSLFIFIVSKQSMRVYVQWQGLSEFILVLQGKVGHTIYVSVAIF